MLDMYDASGMLSSMRKVIESFDLRAVFCFLLEEFTLTPNCIRACHVSFLLAYEVVISSEANAD
jgi:hypothetical protein